MSLCFDTLALSELVVPNDAPAVNVKKARPVGIILEQCLTLDLDAHAISPDFDSRPISPVSACSESSCSSDDTASKVVGFCKPFPTPASPWNDLAQSKLVGFGRKHRSIAVPPSASIISHRKHENRRSLPVQVIQRDGPSLSDPKRRLERRFSLDHSSVLNNKRPTSLVAAARRVSVDILGISSRQPPKPLLLPKQVQARESFPGHVKRCLAGHLPSAASSRHVRFVVSSITTPTATRTGPPSAFVGNGDSESNGQHGKRQFVQDTLAILQITNTAGPYSAHYDSQPTPLTTLSETRLVRRCSIFGKWLLAKDTRASSPAVVEAFRRSLHGFGTTPRQPAHSSRTPAYCIPRPPLSTTSRPGAVLDCGPLCQVGAPPFIVHLVLIRVLVQALRLSTTPRQPAHSLRTPAHTPSTVEHRVPSGRGSRPGRGAVLDCGQLARRRSSSMATWS
ncbi:hypothetical protein C8F04DRAFT_1396366 [Mycena alexandri]|uniref:Uncharacterized protein n=1 Tax=Mycena alexandri TaxID=1745969 RepID=A0AAD6SVV1_9AGAR|nr:hypothetical protein C8F04DRAFT_1396366 [Mycena alexandri]